MNGKKWMYHVALGTWNVVFDSFGECFKKEFSEIADRQPPQNTQHTS